MKRCIVTLSACLAFGISAFPQAAKKEPESLKTKMDQFSSRTGIITKFTDVKLPTLKTKYSAAETRIRKVSSGTRSNTGFFYQIEKKGQYSNATASIEYTDLLEVIKAIQSLKTDVAADIPGNPDYLENKFVTVDGFEVGYFVSGGKATWYLKLEKYGSDNTLFIENADLMDTAFTDAKNKIDELKERT